MSHRVRFSPGARADLQSLTDWITTEAGPSIADAYINLIRAQCETLQVFPRRGRLRQRRPEMRSIPFRRSATIVYRVLIDEVIILRILHRGRDVERDIAALF